MMNLLLLVQILLAFRSSSVDAFFSSSSSSKATTIRSKDNTWSSSKTSFFQQRTNTGVKDNHNQGGRRRIPSFSIYSSNSAASVSTTTTTTVTSDGLPPSTISSTSIKDESSSSMMIEEVSSSSTSSDDVIDSPPQQQELGIGSPAEALIERIFDVLDVDNSGTIDIEELSNFLDGINDSTTSSTTTTTYSPTDILKLFRKFDIDNNGEISRQEFRQTILEDAISGDSKTSQVSADMIFLLVDKDRSGTIDLNELMEYLSTSSNSNNGSGGGGKGYYTRKQIKTLFKRMDKDSNGKICREEFQQAMQVNDDDCPRGYFLNSVKQTCEPLGPIGRFSQRLEMSNRLFLKVYKQLSSGFGFVDRNKIQSMGVSFVLSYSVISNINGAISFSAAWYISCKRTGLSPLVPGQWKSLLASYGMIYGLIQILKPFRVAMAIGMSKMSAEYLEMTQNRLKCNRTIAIACQYIMSMIMMCIIASGGVTLVSLITGVPIF